jgi:hypothetical protein
MTLLRENTMLKKFDWNIEVHLSNALRSMVYETDHSRHCIGR